jgi:hypothetical protein
MVSSEQFLQQLQAGQIGEALALAMRETLELEVTTRFAGEDGAENPSHAGEFLRTKINLLTGKSYNEVSRDLLMSRDRDKLQQFHTEQVNTSHQVIQSHFQQIQELLILWQTSTDLVAPSNAENSNRPQTTTLDETTTRSSDSQTPATAAELNEFLVEQEDLADLLSSAYPTVNRSEITAPESWIPPIESTATTPENKAAIATNPVNLDEEMDFNITSEDSAAEDFNLPLDREDEEWEEWVENDELLPEPVINYSPTNTDRHASIPDWEEHWSQQHSVPISEPKLPLSHSSGFERPNLSDSLEKFAPEYVGFSAITQPERSGDLSQPIWLKAIDDLDSIEQLLADVNRQQGL